MPEALAFLIGTLGTGVIRDRSRRATAAVVAVVVGAASALGCGMRTELGLAQQPTPVSGAVGELMGERDRAELERLATERAGAPPDDGYRIGPDDLLDVRVPDLMSTSDSGTAHAGQGGGTGGSAALPVVSEAPLYQQGLRVNAQGDVTIPFLGAVHAAGMTPSELQDGLGQRLERAGLLRRPQVSVVVAEYRSRVVAVVGSVERPGLYPLTRPGATVADLVWAAGGPSKDAGRIVQFVAAAATTAPEVRLAAAERTHVEGGAVRLDLETLLHATGEQARVLNPLVRPGDVITLAPAGSVLVDGWVDKPGSYQVTRGLTLTGAVAAAGGHLFPADRHHVSVKRVLGNEQHYFVVDLDAVAEGRSPDVPITDGDVIRLPASAGRLVPWGFWAVAKEMIHIYGSVPVF